MNILPLGRVIATLNASRTLTTDEIFDAMERHEKGDWGDLPPHDKAANDEALKNGERVHSVYHSTKGEKFWIITERDRSVTTVLMPEDY